MTIFCVACDHCLREPKDRPWGWTCLKWPRRQGYRYVTPDIWAGASPHRHCSSINQDGDCPLYEPKRDEQMEMIDG